MTDSAKTMRIAAAQTPEFREDVPGALAYLADVARDAHAAGARLLCCPEGFLQGYLTEARAARRVALDLSSPLFSTLLKQLPDSAPTIVVGLIEAEGDNLHNTAVVIHRQTLVGRYRKRHLLAGERCFQPGLDLQTFEVDGLRFGINICFDTNFAFAAMGVAEQGASLLLCPANNMLPRRAAADWKDRHNAVRGERCRETGLWLMSADVTGASDGRVAWGPTAVLNPAGEVVAQLPLDAPGLLLFDMPASATAQQAAPAITPAIPAPAAPTPPRAPAAWSARSRDRD
jgi:predicted amidohydrolase